MENTRENIYEINLSNVKISKGPYIFMGAKSRQELGIKKFVKKMPMCQQLLDDKNDVYAYFFEGDQLMLYRIGNTSGKKAISKFEYKMISLISEFHPFTSNKVWDVWEKCGMSWDKTIACLKNSVEQGLLPEDLCD